MIPWHLIRRTPEEEADLTMRLHRMNERLDMPTEILATEEGFTAHRDGNTGYGPSVEEARRDLWDKENEDVINPIKPDGSRKFALNLPEKKFDIPWRLIKRTVEEEADLRLCLNRMSQRLDMPMEFVETEDGYLARRDGNIGRGATLEEAKFDLWDKENRDAVDPSPPVSA